MNPCSIALFCAASDPFPPPMDIEEAKEPRNSWRMDEREKTPPLIRLTSDSTNRSAWALDKFEHCI
jgi:hypothetical protein